ncbi:MAG: chemotaxis protein CheA [Sulfuricella sp.]|nr:chemotaxis protein CheA [Sulfuricella sp.]
MTIDMSQFFQVFFDETAEHLNEMEQQLLNLDVDAPNPDDLNAIFRAAHSIKGGSGTFGFTDMTGVTHILETLLDRIRKGELAIRPEMIDAFLEARDVLGVQLSGHQNNTEVDEQAAKDICEKLGQLTKDVDTSAPVAAELTAPQPAVAPTPATRQTFHIEFTPSASALEQGLKLDGLFDDLRAKGDFEVSECLATDDSPHCWKMTLTTEADEAALMEIFDFFAEPDQLKISREAAAPAADEDPGYGFFGELPKTQEQVEEEQGFGFFTDLPETQEQTEQKQGYGFFQEIKPPAAENAESKPEPVVAAEAPPTPENHPTRRATDRAAPAGAQGDASIRVSVEKVDQLINLVGELVITQAMLAQTATKVDPVLYESLLNGMATLERNTRDLQESVMSIRMMPIGFVFSRFPRVVRDLANKLGKKVELISVGEGTELDKSLIEKLADPLTHLVRNSLDHGIEMPEKREAAGKPAKGTITLRASHQGGNIMIEVIDDGAGLNREKILAKAREKGIPVNDGMSDADVFGLIFAPGFSTAEVVTDVSGRGVGMDVVKRNIAEMGGQVEIDSSLGHGTRIIIRLPLTLAILDGMSIAVGGEIFIMPLTYIAESLQPAAEDIKTVSGTGQVVHVRGEYIPLIALYKIFGMTPKITDPSKGIVVLLEAEGRKAAMFVDELVGQHQVVIKSLETNYRKVPGVSGATIMGDGRVALILDVGTLVRLSQS